MTLRDPERISGFRIGSRIGMAHAGFHPNGEESLKKHLRTPTIFMVLR